MKKVFLTSVSIFVFSLLVNAQSSPNSTVDVVRNCSTRINFLGLTVWTGSVTTTITTTNPLTGEISQVEEKAGCGKNGGSWDWPWE
jgi:hypothetical protein